MSTTELTSDRVWQILSTILDPEFGLNIVDLGLIYSVACADGAVSVTMTLTTPSCPVGDWIYEGVKTALNELPGIKTCDVRLVFEPPWRPEMLSQSARRHLGWDHEISPEASS